MSFASASPAQPRNQVADLLKGVAVILMVQVHLIEQFATSDIYGSIFGRIGRFLGGPPAAPVFLAVMGYFLASTRKTLPQLLRRGMLLILGGLAVNLGLNANLLYSIHQGRVQLDPLAFIFGADILSLAGLSVILVALLRMVFKHNALAYSVAALVVAIVTQFLFTPDTMPSLLYVVPFFWGDQWWSYFPLFPWFAYPLLGVALATSLTIFDAITSLHSCIQIVLSLVLCSVLLLTAPFAVQSITELPLYYHHGVLLLLWILGFLAIWLFAFSKLEATWGNSRISRYLKWLGKNVTAAYVFQWLIIGNLATELHRSQSLAQVLVWFAAILFATSLLVVLFRAIRAKILNMKF